MGYPHDLGNLHFVQRFMAVYGENVHVTGIPQEILWLWLVPVVLRHPGDSNHLHFGRNFKANTIGCDSNPNHTGIEMGLNPWVGRKMRKGGRTESARWRNIYLPLESHDCHRKPSTLVEKASTWWFSVLITCNDNRDKNGTQPGKLGKKNNCKWSKCTKAPKYIK